MKKILIFLLLSNFYVAQKSMLVYYKMQTAYDGIKNYEAKLHYSAENAVFKYQISPQDSLSQEYKDKGNVLQINIVDKNLYSVFSSFNSANISQTQKNLNNNELVLVNDSMKLPLWQITTETKMINNHLCYKALAAVKGRNYIAWFTYDLPTSFGPWKLNGLPGLILVAEDSTHMVYFEAYRIESSSEAVEEEPTDLKIMTGIEYKTELTKYFDQIANRLQSLSDRDIKISVKTTFKKGLEID